MQLLRPVFYVFKSKKNLFQRKYNSVRTEKLNKINAKKNILKILEKKIKNMLQTYSEKVCNTQRARFNGLWY